MAMRNVNLIKLELKYCENCGALWLRKRGERLLHCQRCRQICSTNAPSHQTRVNQYRGCADEMADALI